MHSRALSVLWEGSLSSKNRSQGKGELKLSVFVFFIALIELIEGTDSLVSLPSFFSGMMVLQLLFVWLIMPETKGLTLEEMEVKLGISPEQLEEELEVSAQAADPAE